MAEPKDQGILQKDEEGNYEYLITVPQLSEQYKNYAILYYNYENSMCEIMDVAEENINFNNTQITFYSSIEGLIFSIQDLTSAHKTVHPDSVAAYNWAIKQFDL